MSTPAFARIDALFHAALALPEAQRARFLDETCGDDRGLRQRLQAMLTQDARDADALAGAVRAGRQQFRGVSETMPERIGPFRLLRRIGQGGMGTVYLGEREGSDFEQRVAIKLLRDLHDSREVSARLRRERRLLARLAHPNIARLVDGGELDDGTPFVAMEYVEGTNLLGHVAERALPLAGRLRLFLQLLEAVAYAHRHLIVHRDLKPENVLVDAEGSVKLLDFGIAKLLEGDDAATSGSTMTAAAAMTPCYASPEQLLGQTVSTQSDVYSLGVMLYELLTGTLPFASDPQLSPLELQNRICTTQAVAPSRTPDAAVPARSLRGDLDKIVLKALRKEPQRRYASVDALADDIRAHLGGRPVSARPDSWRYRAGKFVSRNPVGVGVSLALLATLLLFALTSRWQAVRYAAERDRAESEATAASQVTDYLIDLFRVPDPVESAQRDLTARDLLDKAAASLPGEVDEAPLLRARMMQVIGLSYANIGAYGPAVHLLESALSVRERESGKNSLAVADTLNRLGNIHRTYGRLDLAEATLTRALAIREALQSGPDAELADSFNNVGLLQYQLGHYRSSLQTLQHCIDMHRKLTGDGTMAIAIALHNRTLPLMSLARYSEAESGIRRAIAIKQALGMQDRSTLVNSQALLASMLFDEGHLQQSLALRNATLARRRALYPEGHPSLVSGLLGMSRLQLMLGHPDEAQRVLAEAQRWADRVDSSSRLITARVLVGQGRLALATGDLDGARTQLGEALAIRRAALAADHPDLAEAQYLAGVAALATGDMEEAASLLRSAAGQRETQLPTGHPERREVRLALAALDASSGALAPAREAMTALLSGATPAHTLRSDLVSAWAHRCLAVIDAAGDSATRASGASHHLQAAHDLLAPYLRADNPLMRDSTGTCPGVGWLRATNATAVASVEPHSRTAARDTPAIHQRSAASRLW